MKIKQHSSNAISIKVVDLQGDIINIKKIKSVLFSAAGSKAFASIECLEHYDADSGALRLPLSAEDRDTLGGYQAKIELISDTERFVATCDFVIIAQNIPEVKVTQGTTPTITIDINGEQPEGNLSASFMTSPVSKKTPVKGAVKFIKDVLKIKLNKSDTKEPEERFLSINIGSTEASLIKVIVG